MIRRVNSLTVMRTPNLDFELLRYRTKLKAMIEIDYFQSLIFHNGH